jgi:septum formation protein
MLHIILASSSPARKKQLSQLGINFEVVSPDIDETPLPNEKADDMVLRLAKEKAQKVAKDYPGSWVIGCDQVAEFENIVYGKPYGHEKALKVLAAFSGNTVVSKTGICLMNLAQEKCFTAIEPYSVTFRAYSREQADQYLKIEKPYYSAGSINVDGLGVSLVSAYHGRDYNSLIGLPLIALVDLFLSAGIDVLKERSL